MPLIKSASKKATQQNFDEVRHGNTFKRTEKKFGKDKARKQMVAIVLSNKRKAQAKKHGNKKKRVAGKR
jgi:hypothetical protein